MLREQSFKIGRVIKTHGVNGQISVATDLKITETENWPDWLFLDIDKGLVPFRTRKDDIIWRDEKHLILALDRYTSPDQALELVGNDVWFPNEFKPAIVVSSGEISPMVGFMFVDMKIGELGKIEEWIDLPNNPLFKLIIDGKEVLIPAREEWIIELDEADKRIMMDLPEGLMDIN